jgi:exodeoxyribonuclease VII large subunit
MKSRLQSRFPTKVLLHPASTQGINAVGDIIKALNFFSNLAQENQPNIIIIARGGGSFEDLLPFNDESLAREVFKCKIPIISAIGHETDTTILDFVSDVRAETPTAAIEISTPVLQDLANKLTTLENILNLEFKKFLSQKEKQILNLESQVIHPLSNIERKQEKIALISDYLKRIINIKISEKSNELNNLLKILSSKKFSIDESKSLVIDKFEKIESCLLRNIEKKEQNLTFITKILQSYDYKSILNRGYSLIRDIDNNIIKSTRELTKNNQISVEMSDGIKILNVK